MTAALLPPAARATPPLDNKHLLDEQIWDQLVSRISRDHAVDWSYAERIMDQTLAFLRLCAANSGESYAPSNIVDIGWHMFILFTREYADFCQRLAGRFIHHIPRDEEEPSAGPANGVRTTVMALKAASITVDEPLWTPSGGCSGTRCDGNDCRGNG